MAKWRGKGTSLWWGLVVVFVIGGIVFLAAAPEKPANKVEAPSVAKATPSPPVPKPKPTPPPRPTAKPKVMQSPSPSKAKRETVVKRFKRMDEVIDARWDDPTILSLFMRQDSSKPFDEVAAKFCHYLGLLGVTSSVAISIYDADAATRGQSNRLGRADCRG